MTKSAHSPARPATARSSFECRSRTRVPALDAELTQSIHRPTGARHLHLDLPVEDCAFLMGFLTPAPDSSGLTHVLEHLVMCGSERYPCRRAFFAMLGRTLSTTMNAMTTEDCTAYHFATRSLADYENLLSVYLDAAFFPRLDRLDFDQEGCRVEIETAGEEGETPVRRGVVLNEMRGLMNDPEQHLQQALNSRLFPSTPYRFNAGGDPWRIPALDYEALNAYHRRHYHPGNAVFLSAGSLRPEWLQVRLHELALARFSRRVPCAASRPVSLEIPPLEAPVRSVVRYPVLRAAGTASRADAVNREPVGVAGATAGRGPDSAASARDREPTGASVALAWRLGETSDPAAVIRAQLLARCLLEQGDAPLRWALEAPGSPATALASNGVQVTRRRIVFQCGVHGCDPDLTGEIEARALAAIDGAARDGLDEGQVDGALAQIERELHERHDPRYPFPLKLLTRILPAALYGGDPAGALDTTTAFAALRAETRTRADTAALVRWCLGDNPERASVTAIPDPAAARRLQAEDRARLMREYGPLRPQARRRVIERSRALRRRQESPAGESSLPGLGLDAIGSPRERPELLALPAGHLPAAFRRVPTAEPRIERNDEAAGGPPIRISRGPTGGLVYARLAIDVSGFESDRLDDVGLLGEILPESDHGRLGADETRARIARVCDRLSVEPRLLARPAPGSDASGAAAPRAVLLLSARARACDEAALLEVLADAYLDARFDQSARAAAAKARVRRSKDLTRNGHLHAERIAAARLGPWAAVAERWQGPSALVILAAAAEGGDEGAPLEERLRRVHRALVRAPYQLQIVRDRESRPSGDSDRAWPERPSETPSPPKPAAMSSSNLPVTMDPQGRKAPAPCAAARSASAAGAWVVEGPVNYCAKVFPAVTADHPDAGPLSVLAAVLGGDLLQRTIRERGGAYGAGARYCDRTATLRMFSYRDPRLSETLRDFDSAIEALRRQPPEGRELEEAILRAVREIDRPRAFQIAACERYLDELQGRGGEGVRPLRASVLRVDPEQLREVAGRYLRSTMGRTGVLAGTGRERDLDRLGIPWRRL